ncbi:MAG: L-aspartate oxidase, partial [bacterium]
RANACLLATGGIGQIYRHTTNPTIATGDGIAMAFRAGATVANMEFIQFHPTSLYGRQIDGRVFLVSEAVRGEGAILKTRDGKEFMHAYHPDGSLSPRDVVARAIAAEISRRGDDYVLLDCTVIPAERLRERFPNIYETCLGFGIDITREPIPVVPAAHYVCGGVVVNSWGETTVRRLFAAGECACSGLHGANRLASNSLLDALVFAERAARNATEKYPDYSQAPASLAQPKLNLKPKDKSDQEVVSIVNRLRSIMWRYAGIVRSDQGLKQAEQELNGLVQDAVSIGRTNSVSILEMWNMLLVSRLVVCCARCRTESRGLHYNQDHPLPDERFECDTLISRHDLEPFY